MFSIRLFQPEDFQRVIALESQIFQEHDPHIYMELYESVPGGFYVAEDDAKVIGYAVCFISLSGNGRIFTLAVEERCRGRGVGTQLINRICDVLTEKGATVASLEVRMSNIPAQHFYLRHGFVPAWVERGYYTDGEDALVMKKEL
ncbi:MAG: ribosomal protein S18-alanine N-acetyltransferase [ANME-2 cluster archaeon]|nr:ribosomal protein S18-alanine N-acetyltransferase [ANME-2 cluster archaeon]